MLIKLGTVTFAEDKSERKLLQELVNSGVESSQSTDRQQICFQWKYYSGKIECEQVYLFE